MKWFWTFLAVGLLATSCGDLQARNSLVLPLPDDGVASEHYSEHYEVEQGEAEQYEVEQSEVEQYEIEPVEAVAADYNNLDIYNSFFSYRR